MDRLIAPNSVPLADADTAPASGTPQYATDGNPAASVPATQWPAYQYNAIQEELIAILTAAGIAPDRTQLAQIATAIPLLCPGRQLALPSAKTSSGSYTAPAGTNWVRFLVIGAGGSGAGCLAVTGTNAQAGGPGGAGSWAEIWVPWVGTPIPYTVGAAPAQATGAAGNQGGNSGVAGVVVYGGPGGFLSVVGVAPSGAGSNLALLPTGTPTLGAVVVAQGQGAAGGLSLALNATAGFAGPGGVSILGGGSSWNLSEATGTSGSTYGSGGGGTTNQNANGALSGGIGVQGVVIITPFS